MTTIINLFGGPGIGESTQAALLFAELKKQGKSVELVNEYIKEHIWAQRNDVIRSGDVKQDYIFAKQHKKQYTLEGQVDYVVTDSPLLLSAFYAPKDELYLPLEQYVLGCFRRFRNWNIFLVRSNAFAYQEEGRFQNAEEAAQCDTDLRSALDLWGVPYLLVDVGEHFVSNILALL